MVRKRPSESRVVRKGHTLSIVIKMARQSEVSNFTLTVIANQDISGREITMYKPARPQLN